MNAIIDIETLRDINTSIDMLIHVAMIAWFSYCGEICKVFQCLSCR